MHVLALAVDEAAKCALGGPAPTVNRLCPEKGGFAQHIQLPSAFHSLDESGAPVENLITIGQGDEGHGAVDVLARLHGLDSLGGMKPVLGEESQGVDIAVADVIQRGVGIAWMKLGLPALLFGEAGDPFRFAVAERDAVHQGVAHKEVGEGASEHPQADQSQADAHTASFTECNQCVFGKTCLDSMLMPRALKGILRRAQEMTLCGFYHGCRAAQTGNGAQMTPCHLS